MKECNIINYSEIWREKLWRYMRKTFPKYSDAYIDYCLNCSADKMPSKIVLNGEDEIVGCHLYFCTKVFLNGEEINTHWGHDTFLDSDYRPEIGLDLMLMTKKIRGFGLGLTNVNERLQRVMKKVFFNGVYTYYIINWKIPFSPIQKSFHIKPKLYNKESLRVGEHVFTRVTDAANMNIPNNGYWSMGYRDIDFVRDADFLNRRFVCNNVHSYLLYTSTINGNPCYFVVRQALYRGMPAVTLSDYRYCGDDKSAADIIFKAVKKITTKSNVGILLFVCGDKNMDQVIKRNIHYKSSMDFVSSMNLSDGLSFCITGADSDADFLK